DLHAQQIEQFARVGKAVFCEKPIDLNSGRVRECLAVVNQTSATLMIGFNRRFDPHFMGVKAAIEDGSIGAPEMGTITSRDPGAPPADYITRSGGIFKDMMIHDFDMAVFLMGDMPESVMATGSVLTDKAIEPLGDYDSASAILRWADGRQLSISNSRRASYGYDQRVEVHGSLGMVAAENEHPVRIEVATASGYARPPLHDFFMTRYIAAYANEINAFISAVDAADGGGATGGIPTGIDGLNALLIAEAALESANSGRLVTIES
ncbi:MAG: Gfo/Idh/MocA family oxidoreductase, partial [Pseudomonadota bacterium]|nr:Gfo/Idh/MocA family oxidoreductase [Pseudomonadota bacterium]